MIWLFKGTRGEWKAILLLWQIWGEKRIKGEPGSIVGSPLYRGHHPVYMALCTIPCWPLTETLSNILYVYNVKGTCHFYNISFHRKNCKRRKACTPEHTKGEKNWVIFW